MAPVGVDGHVADLVDDEQGSAGVEAELVGEALLAAGLAEGVDEFGQGVAVNALAGRDGGDAEGGGEMALAGAGRAEQVDELGAFDEVELGGTLIGQPELPGDGLVECRGRSRW